MLRVPLPDACDVVFMISALNSRTDETNEYFESVISEITDACDINNLIIRDPNVVEDRICWNCITSSDSFRKLVQAWNHYDKSKDRTFNIHNISFVA